MQEIKRRCTNMYRSVHQQHVPHQHSLSRVKPTERRSKHGQDGEYIETGRLVFYLFFFTTIFEPSPSFCRLNVNTLIKKVMKTHLSHARAHAAQPEHSWKSFQGSRVL